MPLPSFDPQHHPTSDVIHKAYLGHHGLPTFAKYLLRLNVLSNLRAVLCLCATYSHPFLAHAFPTPAMLVRHEGPVNG